MRGGQWQVLHLLRGARHEAVLLCPRGSPLNQAARNEDFQVEDLNPATLLRWSSKADFVHAHDARAHTYAALAGRPPLVVSRRVAFPIGGGIASKWKYRQPARFVAVSKFVKQRLIEGGIDEKRIRIVYDGVPAMPCSTRLGPVVAPVTEDPRKGSALLREAARLAGVTIHFSGDLAADFGEARLFVYLSHEEGLGSAVLMAMAAGIPVVASRVGGLPEAVEDNATGLLVGNDASEIADVLRFMFREPDAAQRMAAAARARWEAEFKVEHMVDRTEEVYRECLK
jgi:glycosyltransferase involved in cell wall biosynthesis